MDTVQHGITKYKGRDLDYWYETELQEKQYITYFNFETVSEIVANVCKTHNITSDQIRIEPGDEHGFQVYLVYYIPLDAEQIEVRKQLGIKQAIKEYEDKFQRAMEAIKFLNGEFVE